MTFLRNELVVFLTWYRIMKFAQLLSLVPLWYAVANATEDAALSAAVAALPPCAVSITSL